MTEHHIGRKAAGVIALGLVPVAGSLVALAMVTGPDESAPAALNAKLSTQVTALLEQASPAEHTSHGHHFGEKSGKVICAVEPFGTEPANARAFTEVTWVYARHMCAITGAGTSWAMAVRASGPVAIRLGDRPEVQVPQPGAGYPDRVRRLIPARYHKQVFTQFVDSKTIDKARERFKQASS